MKKILFLLFIFNIFATPAFAKDEITSSYKNYSLIALPNFNKSTFVDINVTSFYDSKSPSNFVTPFALFNVATGDYEPYKILKVQDTSSDSLCKIMIKQEVGGMTPAFSTKDLPQLYDNNLTTYVDFSYNSTQNSFLYIQCDKNITTSSLIINFDSLSAKPKGIRFFNTKNSNNEGDVLIFSDRKSVV